MIQINNIYKTFGEQSVLNGVTFTVNDGEVYGIIGSNGAGKTTLLNVISGLERANVGDIRVSGRDIRTINAVPNVIGYVVDRNVAYEYMTAREYLSYLGDCAGYEDDIKESRINQLFDMFDMRSYCDKVVYKYSRGMKQRLAIASVLLGNPKVILMDEPTNALDTEAKENLVAIIDKLKQSGKSVIMSTNSLWDIENYCDKVCFLNKGRLQYESIVEDIKDKCVDGVEVSAEPSALQAVVDKFAETGDYDVEQIDRRVQIFPKHREKYSVMMTSLYEMGLELAYSKRCRRSFKDVFLKEANSNG